MAKLNEYSGSPRFFASEIALVVLAIVFGFAIIFVTFTDVGGAEAQALFGVLFTLCLIGFFRLLMDPDSVRARQSNEVLKLSSQMLESLQEGLNIQSAQRICELLLPATAAIAVAITDKEMILGYAGQGDVGAVPGNEIRTTATHATIADGQQRILRTAEEIGLPSGNSKIRAAIIMPLYRGRDIEGTLKFYYRRANQISKTQESMAAGFAKLISTQIAATALEEQTRLATSMELKALQAQINPHFLFNTLNTIASFIRTDPNKARTLLRDFAVFYRSTLEDADDLIVLEREIAQVKRYFSFEEARFGKEKLQLDINISPEVEKMRVPSFMVQPLVENAVRHGRPMEGKLTVTVTGDIDDDNVFIRVIDDGVGMSEEAVQNILHPESSSGLGIAVKNVHDRIKGYFGPDSRMDVESELGVGTTVTFVLDRKFVGLYDDAPEGAKTLVNNTPEGQAAQVAQAVQAESEAQVAEPAGAKDAGSESMLQGASHAAVVEGGLAPIEEPAIATSELIAELGVDSAPVRQARQPLAGVDMDADNLEAAVISVRANEIDGAAPSNE